MNSLTQFLVSNPGRVLRGTLGVAIVYLAILVTSGIGQIVLLVVATILFLGALFDICGLGLVTNKSIKGSSIRKNTNSAETKITTIALLFTGLIAFLILGFIWKNGAQSTSDTSNDYSPSSVATPPTNTSPSAVKQNEQSQDDMLLYLIEEEKLAHDVYTVMYQTYGAKVFGNILQSEESHQGRVLTLLQARNITDPRSTELGKFKNTELQQLYDNLIAQGKQSAQEAYKVGVAIEEKDIADITKQLATATDQDTVSTLEALRNGSENHLRAFNRQLGSY